MIQENQSAAAAAALVGYESVSQFSREYKRMQAITDSIRVTDTKAYVRIYQRREGGAYTAIPLDMDVLYLGYNREMTREYIDT